MKRMQIQVDEELYRKLKEEAHARGTSMSALIREALTKALGTKRKGLEPTLRFLRESESF